MLSDARGNHVSPGIYMEEKDVTYSVQSLGITSLGLVGETLYGPAFQNVPVETWSDFVDYFGGTSPEKFRGTGLPKYELPYVAKSYLEESRRLNVVRVLGLSGYRASNFWALTTPDEKKPIVVLRSKMSYQPSQDEWCEPNTDDTPIAIVTGVKKVPYIETIFNSECITQGSGNTTTINSGAGYFGLEVTCREGYGYNTKYTFNVNLDPGSNNYIYKVLSARPDTGTTPIYVEAVYESAFNEVDDDDVLGFISGATDDESIEQTFYFHVTERKHSEGNEYLYMVEEVDSVPTGVKVMDIANTTPIAPTGGIVTVSGKNITIAPSVTLEWNDSGITTTGISYFKQTVTVVSGNDIYTDFLEGYRAAQTPWIVSDALVTESAGTVTASMKKLFKFITISDGDAANYQVKVSIQNIRPSEGSFDVVVRDFNDTDSAPVILERFSRCNLVAGDTNFIGLKIGTSDGGYEAKSKYILVQMADAENLAGSFPAGFIGYPMPKYGCDETPDIIYNSGFNTTLKAKKQYFGFSDLTGIDSDLFAYKGKYFYDGIGDANPDNITKGFHMDSCLPEGSENIYIDGVPGFKFTVVDKAKISATNYAPRLINAPYLDQTLYEDINTRKFTVCFYGGFDGWDLNREQRSNTDDFKASRYNYSGSTIFSRVSNYSGLNAPLNLPTTAITSDYYAFLAGYRTFCNPQDVDINVFATPGINWYDNMLLTEEVIDVIEDTEDGRGGDALYVMNSPYGYEPDELADMFNDTEINSSYACTYAPWVMFYDSSNRKYLDLPVTKDVVRNMAATDNKSYPWYAPAGIERGNVNCVKANYKTTLAQEDVLYENRINPVKTFAQDGVKIWGNKTAYSVESPLNRVNVRRLMIRVKKLISEAAKSLIFTQYDDSLDQQFRGLVEPILNDVKSNRGISDYRIKTEITAETKDQHILPARILVKPINALEYISISFVIYPESVAFED